MLRLRRLHAAVLLAGGVIVAAGLSQLPVIGAGGLLHPARRPLEVPPPAGCENTSFASEGLTLQGWRCAAAGPRRATLVYLHGIADNRASGAGIIARFVPRGFDVVAYDSRAHGVSDGHACTYGFFEKDDLHRVLDALDPPFVLMGTSLGAAVALQHAARDPQVHAVVAAEPFSDLRTVATERAPYILPPFLIRRAFARAEQQGRFSVDAVSPVAAARSVTAPVLLIHGSADGDTSPDHARRIFAALSGPKRLILVPGAHHNESLRGEVWPEIERWLDAVVPNPD